MRRKSNHVDDSHLQRDGGVVPDLDDFRAVALALGAAVAGTGNTHVSDANSIATRKSRSLLRGHRGAG